MLLQKTSETDVLFESGQNMSTRLADIAQFTLSTSNFVCETSFYVVDILGRARGEKLLTLEALFISEIKPTLNTKDEFRSRELKLKF